MLKAIANRAIVEVKKNSDKSSGGIILPDSIQKGNQQYGEVVSIGIGRLLQNGLREDVPVAVGDKVVIDCSFGCEVVDEGKTYYIFEFDNIIAKVEE